MHAVYLVGAPNSMLAICSWVLPVHFFQLLEMKFIGGWECQNAGTWLFTLHFHAGRIPFVYILLLQGICATWERKSENHIKTFACASLSVNTKSCGMWSTKSFDVQWQKNMICDVGDVGLGIDVAKPGGGDLKCASPKPAFLSLLQVGKKMYRALHANLHVFSSRQRKFLEKDGRYLDFMAVGEGWKSCTGWFWLNPMFFLKCSKLNRDLKGSTWHLDEEVLVELENGLTWWD